MSKLIDPSPIYQINCELQSFSSESAVGKSGNRTPFRVCHGLGGFTHTDPTWIILLGRQFVDRLRRKLILETKSLANRLRSARTGPHSATGAIDHRKDRGIMISVLDLSTDKETPNLAHLSIKNLFIKNLLILEEKIQDARSVSRNSTTGKF